MKYASEDLKNEHGGVLLGLEILEKIAGRLTAGENVEENDLTDMVNFLKLFADKCHHGKEENIFFPEMEKYGVQNEGGPIGQMLLEHTEGRGYIADMAQSLENRPADRRRFASSATSYINLMRNHINKENTVLFPLGDRAIPPAVQERLLESFEKHEGTVMGVGTHERLHAMLHAFTEKYLS